MIQNYSLKGFYVQQSIGYAFYLHLMGTLAWVIAFLCALTTTYKFISGNADSNRYGPSFGDVLDDKNSLFKKIKSKNSQQKTSELNECGYAWLMSFIQNIQ